MPDEELFFKQFCSCFRESIKKSLKEEDNIVMLGDDNKCKRATILKPYKGLLITTSSSFIGNSIDFVFRYNFTLNDSAFLKSSHHHQQLSVEIDEIRRSLKDMIQEYNTIDPTIKELSVVHTYGPWIGVEITV